MKLRLYSVKKKILIFSQIRSIFKQHNFVASNNNNYNSNNNINCFTGVLDLDKHRGRHEKFILLKAFESLTTFFKLKKKANRNFLTFIVWKFFFSRFISYLLITFTTKLFFHRTHFFLLAAFRKYKKNSISYHKEQNALLCRRVYSIKVTWPHKQKNVFSFTYRLSSSLSKLLGKLSVTIRSFLSPYL